MGSSTLVRMLSEKRFRERTKVELREIGKQVASLATDRDVYRKLEHHVIAKNTRLQGARHPFIDMVRGAYTDAMAVRVLRLLDAGSSGLSLRRVLTEIADYPQLLHDKVGDREFGNDSAAMDRASAKLKAVMDAHFSHHERRPSAMASRHRALDEAIDAMISTLKTYYWVVAEAHLDLEPSYTEDPLAIFRFTWMK